MFDFETNVNISEFKKFIEKFCYEKDTLNVLSVFYGKVEEASKEEADTESDLSLMEFLYSYAISSEDHHPILTIKTLLAEVSCDNSRTPSPRSIDQVTSLEFNQKVSESNRSGKDAVDSDMTLKISVGSLICYLDLLIFRFSKVLEASSSQLEVEKYDSHGSTADEISRLNIFTRICFHFKGIIERERQEKIFYDYPVRDFIKLLSAIVAKDEVGLVCQLSIKVLESIFNKLCLSGSSDEDIIGSSISALGRTAEDKKGRISSDPNRFGGPWVCLEIFIRLVDVIGKEGLKDKVKAKLEQLVGGCNLRFINALVYGNHAVERSIHDRLLNADKSLALLDSLGDGKERSELNSDSLAICLHKKKDGKFGYRIKGSKSSYKYFMDNQFSEFLSKSGGKIVASDIDNTLFGDTQLTPELFVLYLQHSGVKALLIISNCLHDRVPELEDAGYIDALKNAGINWYHFPLGQYNSKAVFLDALVEYCNQISEKIFLGWELIDDRFRSLSYEMAQTVLQQKDFPVEHSWLYKQLLSYITSKTERMDVINQLPYNQWENLNSSNVAVFCESFCLSLPADMLLPESLFNDSKIKFAEGMGCNVGVFSERFFNEIFSSEFQLSISWSEEQKKIAFFTPCPEWNEGSDCSTCRICSGNGWDPCLNAIVNLFDNWTQLMSMEFASSGVRLLGPSYVANAMMPLMKARHETQIKAARKNKDQVLRALVEVCKAKEMLANNAEGKLGGAVVTEEVVVQVSTKESSANNEELKRLRKAKGMFPHETLANQSFMASLRFGSSKVSEPQWDSSTTVKSPKAAVTSASKIKSAEFFHRNGGPADKRPNDSFEESVSRSSNKEAMSGLHDKPWR